MATGTVRVFDETSGLGSISPDGPGRALRVSRADLAGGITLSPGERVEFTRRDCGAELEAVGVTQLLRSTMSARPRLRSTKVRSSR